MSAARGGRFASQGLLARRRPVPVADHGPVRPAVPSRPTDGSLPSPEEPLPVGLPPLPPGFEPREAEPRPSVR
ncbi:hypothetical protein G6W55_20870 [Streptomyces sp. CAI-85]|nr:hypothetical protein [Streptomyces sp. CAI-85]